MASSNMDVNPVVYQDVADGVLTVASKVDALTDELSCYICGLEYGSAGLGMDTHLDYLSQLPGAFRKTFVQFIVEASRTACGHTFCTFCLSAWFKDEYYCTCPMCRTKIIRPFCTNIENTDDGAPNVGIEGLSLSLGISSPRATAFVNILRLQVRDLLTTTTPMPFVWNAAAMIDDLPLLMVTIARRMHYQAQRSKEGVPKDLPYMALHHPNCSLSIPKSGYNLEFLQRADAPLARHPDSHKLYEFLCSQLEILQDVAADRHGICRNWEGPARDLLFGLVREEMPNAECGVGETKWWNYVWCVVKALCVWQAYCERARKALCRRTLHIESDIAGVGSWVVE
jgi:hypothetical protein